MEKISGVGVSDVLSTEDILSILEKDIEEDEAAITVGRVCLSHQQIKAHLAAGLRFFNGPITNQQEIEAFARWITEAHFVIR